MILTEVMDLFELDAIEVSEHDILRGAALTTRARKRPLRTGAQDSARPSRREMSAHSTQTVSGISPTRISSAKALQPRQ